MVEFQAFSEDVKVSGMAILSTIEGLGAEAQVAFSRKGYSDIDPQGWYPQQMWLDVLYELAHDKILDLVAIGMKIPETAVFPPQVITVHDALTSIDIAYKMNHQGEPIGAYAVQEIGQGYAKMVCTNPYPSDFDYGIIYAMVKKFMPEGYEFIVERADRPSRRFGDDRCIYEVHWSEK